MKLEQTQPIDPETAASQRRTAFTKELKDLLVEHAEVVAADLPTTKAAEKLGVLRDRIRLVIARIENAGRDCNNAYESNLQGKLNAAHADYTAALVEEEREQSAALARVLADWPDAEGDILPVLRFRHCAAKALPFRAAAASAKGRYDSLETEKGRPYGERIVVAEVRELPIPDLAKLREMPVGAVFNQAGHLIAAVLACKVRP